MILNNIDPFSINWKDLQEEKNKGEKGFSLSKTKLFGDIKIRQVHYSENYLADHWCVKGHILHILEGELILDYNDGTSHLISAGCTHIVGDNSTPHRARSNSGAKVMVID